MTYLDASPLNQLDPAWKYDKLGTCPDATIGSDGCLICGFALLGGSTPPVVNGLMIKNGLYYRKCLAATFDIRRIGLPEAPALIEVTSAYQSTPFPYADLVRLWNHAKAGNPALVCVDFDPSTAEFQQHWVAVVGAFGTGADRDLILAEPWGGRQVSAYQRFSWIKGQPPLSVLQRALVRAVLYAPSVSRARSARAVAVAADKARQSSPAHLPEHARWG